MQRYSTTIKGITPLLMCKPEQYGFDTELIEKRASTDMELAAARMLYLDKNGRPIQPAIHVERTMMEGAKKLKVRGAGKATYAKLFGSMVSVEPDEILHRIDAWEIHKALVVIKATGGRVIRYRPMFREWELRFVVAAEDEIPSIVVKEALVNAGKYSGLGDFRPQKSGKFGKFEVTSFEQL